MYLRSIEIVTFYRKICSPDGRYFQSEIKTKDHFLCDMVVRISKN